MFDLFRSAARGKARDAVAQAPLSQVPVAQVRVARGPAIRALEPRFVFDGAVAPAAAQAQADTHAQGQPQGAAPDSHASDSQAHAAPASTETGQPAEPAGRAGAPERETASAGGRHEIVVVDRNLPDLATLLSGVPANAEILLIDPTRDGFDQLATALQGRTDIDAIHILSHGSAGDLRLGNGALTAETITGRYAADLAAIGRALGPDGDLLIYGCDFAAGEAGARAASLLAQATGADVAASNDDTGDPALGGNWNLEVHEGAIETGVILDYAAEHAWHHQLAAATITVTGDPTVRDGGGNAVTTGRAANGVTYYDVNGQVVGTTAFWANAGTVGGVNVSLRATVVSTGEADDGVSFATSASGNDATVLIRSQAVTNPAANRAASVTIRWDLVRADNPNVAVAADIDLQIGDIDGIGGQPNTRESVTPSQAGLTSYTLGGTTDLVVDSSNDRLRVSGTQDETASPPTSASIVRFDWTNTSNWLVTYDLAANGTTGQAAFQHDGDRTLTIDNPMTKLIPKIDLDGNDSSGATGLDYRTGYTENGAGVPVTDIDPVVSNTSGTVSGATVVLTNAQAGDRLTVGGLPPGITATTTTASGTITVTLSGSGTPADYQTALHNITYDSTSDDPSTTDRILHTRVSSDGVQGTNSTTTISVTAVDDAPTHTLPPPQSTTEDTALTFSTARGNALTVADPDVQAGSLTTTLSVAHGTLSLGSTGGVTVSGDGTGTVVLSGTVAQINGALDGLTYRPAADYNGADTLGISTNDNGNTGTGGPQSRNDSLGLTVTPVNDPPSLDLDVGNPGTGYDGGYTEGGAGSAVAAGSVAIRDVDSPNLASAQVAIGNGVAGDVLSIAGTLPAGITASYNAATFTLTLTGAASQADYQSALAQVRYASTSRDPGTTTRTVSVSVNDGALDSNVATARIAVTPVDDPPAHALPPAQSTAEDTALTFSTARGNAITVSDPDAGAGNLTTTLTTGHGTLTLGSTTGVTVSGNGSGSVTVTGTAAQINAALNGLVYNPVADYNGADTLGISTNDNGNTGTGGPLTRSDSLGLTVTPVNDPPSLDLDAGAAGTGYDGGYTEGGAGSAVAAGSVAIRDVDSPNLASAQVAIGNGVAGDVLSIAGALPAGITASYDAGTFTLTLTGAASQADYQSALAQVRYASTSRDPGTTTRTVSVSVNDGALDSNVATARIAVTPVDDPPAHALPAPQSTAEDTALTFSTARGNAITVSDPDAGAGNLATTLTTGHGTLTLGSTTGVTVSGNGSGSVTVTGTAAQINVALDGLTYRPTADYNGADTLGISTNDNGNSGTGGPQSRNDSLGLTVTPVNDAPSLDLDAGNPGTGYDGSYTEGGAGSAVAAGSVAIRDVDSPNLASAQVAIGNGVAGDVLSIAGTLPAGITASYNAATFTLTLTGAASQADYQTALAQVRYASTSRDPGTTTRTVSVSVNDGALDSNVATARIAVTPVDDPPAHALPAPQSTAEDTALTFSTARGNAITVSDPDAQAGSLTTTLSVAHGTLSLGSAGGVTVSGDGTGTVTLSGTVAQINAALDGLTYRPAADYNGSDALGISTNDNGNSGNGGPLTRNDTLGLTVNAANDAPDAGPLPSQGSLEGAAVRVDVSPAFSDRDGNRLTFSAAGLPAGLAINPATGIVSGTVDRAASLGAPNGIYSVTVTADDGQGGFASTTFAWRVVDPAPIARADNLVVTAGQSLDGSVLGDNGNGPDTDPDGDTLGISAVNGNAGGVGQPLTGSQGGTFTIRGDGTFRFDPGTAFADLGAGEARTTQVSYTVSDGQGGFSAATLSVTVNGPLQVPSALPPQAVAARDGASVALPAGILFGDGATGYAASGLPPGLSIDPATGAITGTVDRGASGATGLRDYAVSLTATAADGSTATRSFVWRVTDPAPTASSDTASTAEDQPVTVDVLANATDPDGDTLTLVTTGDAAPRAGHGQVAVTNGRLVYTPDDGFNGTDTITYTVSDGNGGLATGSVAVTVTPVNDAPTATALPDQASRAGQSIAYDLSGRFGDPDIVQGAANGDTLRFSATGLPAGLSIDPATGIVGGTLSGAPGLTLVQVTATDSAGTTVTRSFNWTVASDLPATAPDAATTAQGMPVFAAVGANDGAPGNAVTLVGTAGAASAGHGTVAVDPALGLLTYTPDAGFRGTDTVVYTVRDALGRQATGYLTVTVTPVDNRPTAPDTLAARNGLDDHGISVPLGALFADPDGDRLAYSATGLPPGLTIDPATGTISGTIARDASGPSGASTTLVTVRATDPGGLSVERTFAWTIRNPGPQAADDAATLPEDGAVDIEVRGNDTDPDGDPLTVVAGSAVAGHGTVTINPDGSLHYEPAANFNGTDRILYTVSDGNGGLATGVVTLTVTPVNDAPVVDPSNPALADVVAQNGQTLVLPTGPAYSDVDAGDSLTFAAQGLPAGLAIDPATGQIAGRLAPDASTAVPGGRYTVTVTVTDRAGATATGQFTIFVGNPDPIAADDSFATDEDVALTGNVLANDRQPGGGALRVEPEPVTGPAHGRLELRPDGSFTYRPDADFHGEDGFRYALVNADGGRTTGEVRIVVGAVNDAPEGPAQSLVVPADSTRTGRIAATDRDGGPLVYRLAEAPASGTVSVAADGTYAYTPRAGFDGTDRFTVSVTDDRGAAIQIEVTVTVTPNGAPAAPPPPGTTFGTVPGSEVGFGVRPRAAPPLPASEQTIATEGFVLPAVAGFGQLETVSGVVLADGAVVAAVNGARDLGGVTLRLDRSVVEQESDRLARLSAQRIEGVGLVETPWFFPRPFLGGSLGVPLDGAVRGDGGGLLIEAVRRSDALAISVRDVGQDGMQDGGAIAQARLLGADGSALPAWIEGDGNGSFWGRPPSGTGRVAFQLEITLRDGRVLTREVVVDAETGEIAKPPERKPVGAKPTAEAAPLFSTQLAATALRGSQSLDLIEMALARLQ